MKTKPLLFPTAGMLLLLLVGCGRSPGTTAVDYIKACDDARETDAEALLTKGGQAQYWNEWNFNPWVVKRGDPAPHWVDHVTVTKSEVPDKNSYGEELATVTCDVYPRNGGAATWVTYRMIKEEGQWRIRGSESPGLMQKPIHP